MKQLLELFRSFFIIGLFTFGGGYAMLPLFQRELVDRRKWSTEEELADYYAVAQCTPGVIAVNTATFLGYKIKGIAGGITATLGVITPSMIIITIIAALIRNFADIEIVAHALNGIQICVCVLILDSVLRLAKKALINKVTVAVFIIVLAMSLILNISAVYLILGSLAAGLLLSLKRCKE